MRATSLGILIGTAVLAFGTGCRPPAPKSPTATPGTPAALTGDWTLVEVAGHTAPLGADHHPGTIQFNASTSKVSGFAGCNRFSGGYTASGDTINFGPLALTKMACEEGMDLENAFTDALSRAKRFQMVGGSLVLLGEPDSLARFERPEKP